MNIYTYQFEAICPADAARISYRLTIRTQRVIMAEDIVAACSFTEPTLHEAAADMLIAKFGGSQTLVASHGGVTVETLRGDL